MTKKKKVIIASFITLIWANIVWVKYRQYSLQNSTPAPRNLLLSEEQQKEVVQPKKGSVMAYRYLDENKIWQVGIGEVKDQGSSHLILGHLFKEELSPEVTTPIYLCAYEGFGGKNLSFDVNKNCSGEGKLVENKPIGFASEQVRTGFRMLARCKNQRSGMYLTHNLRCDQPDDRLHGGLASISLSE